MHPVRLLLLATLTTVAEAQEWLPLDGSQALVGNVAYDRARQRAVLFGPTGEVWELEGTRALHRAVDAASPQPGARQQTSLVYDEARGHVLLFGGMGLLTPIADTWTWNGLQWAQPFSLLTPPRRLAARLTFDTARQRVLLHGGLDQTSVLTDTWEHDGSQWVERLPATVPAPLVQQRLCFDRSRSVAVLVGSSPAGTHMMLYEWNGTDWQLRTPTLPVPPVRTGYGFAYDEARARCVLTGGLNNTGEVWEWNGATWSLAGNSPAFARTSPAMWFDPLLNEVIVAGGNDVILQSDAWGWNGTTATQRAPLRTPRHGGYASVWAWSPADGRAMLHSGNAANQAIADSWIWDGNNWTSRTFAAAPPPRWLAASAADPLQSRLFVFGGMDAVQVFRDLWSWDGSNWTALTGAPMPPARSAAGLAFDSTRGELVLFGGQDSLGAELADTWTWNGAWFARSAAAAPSARHGQAMAFDAGRSRTVLWGGRGQITWQNDTWEWDGNQWLAVLVPNIPLVAGPGSMVYDRGRGRILLLGMHAPGGPTPICCDTGLWQYDGTTWTQITLRSSNLSPQLVYDERRDRLVAYDGALLLEWSSPVASVASYGSGCGAPLLLTTRTRARIGAPHFGLEVTGTAPGAAVLFGLGFAPANQSIGGGCTLLIGGQAASALQIANTAGIAVQPIALPQSPVLRGLTVFAQSGALAPSSSALSLSRGLQITVGD